MARKKSMMMRRDIVVIGASAGGVEALQALFAGLPASLPAAVFVVLHIPSHTASKLHLVLDRAGPLPVILPEDGDPIVPGLVYVASSDHHLLVENDRIRITRGPRENRVRPAIDVLFRSAAHTFGPRVIGILLSGNLDDGSAGLWAIKDQGGIALVQAPDDAQYSSMPQSAIQQVNVDHVLPVSRMPAAILSLVQEPVMTRENSSDAASMRIETDVALGNDSLKNGSYDLGPISPNTCPECHGALIQITEGFITRYRCHTGHAFSFQTLFSQVNEEIDSSLWNTLRAIDERIILLRQRERQALAERDETSAVQYAREVRESEQRKAKLRGMVIGGEINQILP
jgi:two-component system chemotaxis response regulator CheB